MTSTNIEIICADEEVLGGGEWSPSLELFIDESGSATLIASQRHSSDNATLMTVWHGRDHEWRAVLSQGSLQIPSRKAIEELAVKLQPLVDRLVAGRSVDCDGSNHVGRLTDDADEAREEIDDIFSRLEDGEAWARDDLDAFDADDWICGAEYDGITATTTDEEIEEIAARDEAEARANGIILLGWTADLRRKARDEMRDEMQDDDS